MCQNNYIYCCFSFFHITWTSPSASLDWMKGGLFREETHPNSKASSVLSWLPGILSLAEANSTNARDLLVPLCRLLGEQECLPYKWPMMSEMLSIFPPFPCIPSTHVFFLTEGEVLWNVNSLPGSQSLKRNLVEALMKVSSFCVEVFSNASEVHFYNFKIKPV